MNEIFAKLTEECLGLIRGNQELLKALEELSKDEILIRELKEKEYNDQN